ncbi:MAG: hypothetical protein ABMA00_04730 [Gemmatimonas sp.]
MLPLCRWPLAACGTSLLTIIALLLGASAPLAAQAVTGAGADATALPKGAMRWRVAGIWEGSDKIFTASGAQPMYAGIATGALGTARLPQLSAAEQAIRTLSGLTTFSLSLGPLESTADTRQSITPLSLELGVTPRLSVGVVVPYIESRDNALLVLNRAGVGATVGQNPAYSATAGSAARSSNGALLRQLAQSRTQLASEIARCAPASATGCDAIRADPSGAQQLVNQALSTQNAIVTIYGDSVRGGAPVVPISNSATQAAINALIGSMRTAFNGFGVTTLTEGVLPASATIVNGPGAIARIANDTAYGLDYSTLGGTRRAGIGDIDLTASYLWLNTLGERPAQWLAATRFGVRSQFTAGWRFGTAGADRPHVAFDVPIGDGANALLARSTTDVVFNRFLWMSGTLRIVQPLGDRAVIRRPLLVDSMLFVPSTIEPADRSLGRRVDLEVAPRVMLGRFFGLSGGYLYRRSDADRYTFSASDSLTAGRFAVNARTYQAYMLGATFSTLSSYARGRSKWPVEVLYVHVAPITGTGSVAATSSDRLELRVYTGFPRR